MERFTTESTYKIQGRGMVHAVRLREPRKAGEMRVLCGQEVELDGEVVRVKDVEMFAVGDNQSVREIGLLIAPLTPPA